MAKKIYNILKKEKTDIVHIQDSSILIAGLIAAKRLKIPTVFTVRDYRFACNLSVCLKDNTIPASYSKKTYRKWLYQSFKEAYNFGPLSYLVLPWFYRQNNRLIHYFKKIDSYITVSDFVKKQVIKSGIIKEKVRTIKVQKQDWKPSNSSKEMRIFTAGGLKATKGFDFLIKSFKIVANKHPQATLRIAGKGSARKKLEDLVARLHLSDNVFFLGQIDHEQIQKEYADCTFTISPSLWPEPLTRIIFETFSMKKTIVATNVGGSPELVRQNKTGLLVRPGDINGMANSIIRLINNSKLRKTLANNAFNLIQKESNSALVYENHIKVYRDVIKKTIESGKGI